MPSLSDRIRAMSACYEAQTWVDSLPPETTPEAAWADCARGDWLLWVAAHIGVDSKLLVLAACACARTALPFWEQRYPEDRRPHEAIEAAEAWARGEAPLERVRETRAAAASAADAAASAAYDAARAYDAAAYAASAAYAAADAAAAAAARAAYAAAHAAVAAHDADADAYADAAAYAAAYAASLRVSAELVRNHIPWATVAERLTPHAL